VDYPVKASSSGGRYEFRNDDWQFYDTQIASYEFGKDNDKLISWEGLSCSPYPFFNRGRGSLIRGTTGAMIVDRGGYEGYELDNKVIKERKESGYSASQTNDTIGRADLTTKHFYNVVEAIRGKENPHSHMTGTHKSTVLVHLANIAQKAGDH